MVIVAAIAVPAAAAAVAPIKIVARPYIDPELAPVAVEGKMVAVAGAVDGARAGDAVVIEARRCARGAAFQTAGRATTTDDGLFAARVPAYTGTFFRARLGNVKSSTVAVRWPAPLRVTTRRVYGALRIGVFVVVTEPEQSFRGRFVELQRRVGDRWTRVRRARLAERTPLRFATRFEYWVRGVSLRVVVGESAAAPCYSVAVSRTLRS